MEFLLLLAALGIGLFIFRKTLPAKDSFVFLDIETTGLGDSSRYVDEIVEIAIVDHSGNILINSFVKPIERKTWVTAQRIHGISPSMVKSAPTLSELNNKIMQAISGKNVVIYNAEFEKRFLSHHLANAKSIKCCMLRFAKYNGERKKNGEFRWLKLQDACQKIGYVPEGKAHRALADVQAARAVWQKTTI